MRARLAAALLVLLTAVGAPASAVSARYDTPVEDYASYQPQTFCRRTVLPGTAELAAWINRRFDGGTARATLRACGTGGTSEHKDGRAIDWSMNAASAADRATVREFLTVLRRADLEGNEDALARRMGVMYVIWNDHMYASWREFAAEDYLSGGCKRLATCSKTLRHRDHVHISLGRPGARAETSWYLARAAS